MAKRITATDAARRFSDILDAVEHAGEEFVVERHGRPVAALAPAGRSAPTHATWADVLAVLERAPRPDRNFARDLNGIRRARPGLPKDPWGRSSTRRS